MAALRGISLSQILCANMKNIQEVYRINMGVEHLHKKGIDNSVDLSRKASIDEKVPGWLEGNGTSSDDSDFEESPVYVGLKEKPGTNTDRLLSTPHEIKCSTSEPSSPTSSSTSHGTKASGDVCGTEAVVKGEYLSLRQGTHVELMGVNKFREVVCSYDTIASLICSFLNGREGGEVFGVALTRKQRDDVRQVVDRVVSQMIHPRLPTMLVGGKPLVVSMRWSPHIQLTSFIPPTVFNSGKKKSVVTAENCRAKTNRAER